MEVFNVTMLPKIMQSEVQWEDAADSFHHHKNDGGVKNASLHKYSSIALKNRKGIWTDVLLQMENTSKTIKLETRKTKWIK